MRVSGVAHFSQASPQKIDKKDHLVSKAARKADPV